MRTLHIFVKNPRLGYVKTRLAATVGDEEALQVYFFLLKKTREAALAASAQRLLWYSDEATPDDDWAATQFDKRVQRATPDLGARMRHAFEVGFAEGATSALIIGSDCPTLTGALLDEAFDRLQRHEAVIGPVADGGYYLLGMTHLIPELFEDVAWSTESVLPTTLERLQAGGHSYALLPLLHDVDNEADWVRAKHELGIE
jgi:uncharacterized protein